MCVGGRKPRGTVENDLDLLHRSRARKKGARLDGRPTGTTRTEGAFNIRQHGNRDAGPREDAHVSEEDDPPDHFLCDVQEKRAMHNVFYRCSCSRRPTAIRLR